MIFDCVHGLSPGPDGNQYVQSIYVGSHYTVEKLWENRGGTAAELWKTAARLQKTMAKLWQSYNSYIHMYVLNRGRTAAVRHYVRVH